MLQRQRKKEQTVEEMEGEGSCQACCSTANERQATSQRKSTREHERMVAETPEERHSPLVRKDFQASVSTQRLTNACVVAATSTFRSYTALPTT